MFQKLFPHTKKRKKKYKSSSLYADFFTGQKTGKNYKKRNNSFRFSPVFPKIFGVKIQMRLALLGITTLGILLGVYGVFSSPYTQISNIYIYREDSMIDVQRAYSQVEYIRGENIISFDRKKLAQRLQRGQNSLQNIRIDISLPSTLEIYLSSHEIAFTTPKHIIFENGAIESLNNDSLGEDIPSVHISENLDAYIREARTLDPLRLSQLKNLSENIRKNILGFTIQDIIYFVKQREVILSGSQGALYIFDLERNLEQQIKKIAIYKTENTPTDSYTYVDARIPNKLFNCSSEQQVICNNNLLTIYGDTIESFLP